MDIDATDEFFHAASDDADWKESGWFGFSIPDRDINVFTYYFHDVRTGVSGGGPAVWDPTGQEVYDCLFYDCRWNQPLTGAMDYTDFTLPNSLHHRVAEPLRRYQLAYSALGLEFDLEWTAIMAPHALGPASPENAHLDQAGRMTGTMRLNGEEFNVDSFSMRDRTWGPHRPGARRSGDYLWAVASPDEHWHAITMASDTPGVDMLAGGYLVRDGQLGELKRGSRTVPQRKRGATSRVVFDAEDSPGRMLHAEGEVRSVLRWLGWPGRMTFWTLTDWRWDGVAGWGEDQEFFAREQVRALY